MKTLTAVVCASSLVIGCNQSSTYSGPELDASTRTVYEKNLGTLKAMIDAVQNEQMESWSTYVADTARWNPATYGALPSTKAQWLAELTAEVADWDSLRLMNANFLPGLDRDSKDFDGSVRYYGLWVGRHKSGIETIVSYYATADFNKEGKIVVYSEYYDAGGLLNAIKPKE